MGILTLWKKPDPGARTLSGWAALAAVFALGVASLALPDPNEYEVGGIYTSDISKAINAQSLPSWETHTVSDLVELENGVSFKALLESRAQIYKEVSSLSFKGGVIPVLEMTRNVGAFVSVEGTMIESQEGNVIEWQADEVQSLGKTRSEFSKAAVIEGTPTHRRLLVESVIQDSGGDLFSRFKSRQGEGEDESDQVRSHYREWDKWRDYSIWRGSFLHAGINMPFELVQTEFYGKDFVRGTIFWTPEFQQKFWGKIHQGNLVIMKTAGEDPFGSSASCGFLFVITSPDQARGRRESCSPQGPITLFLREEDKTSSSPNLSTILNQDPVSHLNTTEADD